MQRVRRKYAINRSKKKSCHKGSTKQRQSFKSGAGMTKEGFHHAKGDITT